MWEAVRGWSMGNVWEGKADETYGTYETYVHRLLADIASVVELQLMANGFIPKHGGYQDLLTYQKALIVYQATVCFCSRFLAKYDRTIDQMTQAARSGKQNILEASLASATSKGTEIKLTNVARASLEELLEDYRDFLRARAAALWAKNSAEAAYVRQLAKREPISYETYRQFIESRPSETVANILICLIHQTNYLLDKQLRHLEQAFLQEGGLRERMTRARLDARNRKDRQ